MPGGEFVSLSDMVRRGAQDGDTEGRSYARYVDVNEDGVNTVARGWKPASSQLLVINVEEPDSVHKV